MPLAIQANHALADGRHIGELYQAFEEISEAMGESPSLRL